MNMFADIAKIKIAMCVHYIQQYEQKANFGNVTLIFLCFHTAHFRIKQQLRITIYLAMKNGIENTFSTCSVHVSICSW